MAINNEILEKRFKEFSDFVSKQDGKPFVRFESSEFIDNNENYKYSVYNEARENLGNKFWKPDDVGTGKIKKAIDSAIKTRVNHNYQMTDNNLVDWRKKDNFSKRTNSRSIEQLFFDLYKSKIKDQIAFERLINEGLSYQFIAYLFFIKDSNKYLPISQEQFDKIFEYIGINDFKTRNNVSWDNYFEFCNIIKSVRDFLKTKDEKTTLLDAHSFLWILGWQLDSDTKSEKGQVTLNPSDNIQLPKPDWNLIITNPEITTDYDLSIFQALYSFENHQAYASQIGLILGHTGKTPQSPINLEIGHYAKRIAKHFDIEFTKRENQKFKYWDLFFNGWNEGDFFMWQLKPEIVIVLEQNKLTGIKIFSEEISNEESEDLYEGAKKTVIVNAYERNPKARSLCLEHWGTKCSVCGFDFEKKYGEIGQGFIHVHHLIPVSQIGKSYQIDP
ncbi:MAG: hypothetical protein WC108_06495, partial [Bacteroidales bacterium]